jgi:hypothetical protein
MLKMVTLWKNNLNFAKEVPMMYANCIMIVIIVSEKNNSGITFVRPLVFNYAVSC